MTRMHDPLSALLAIGTLIFGCTSSDSKIDSSDRDSSESIGPDTGEDSAIDGDSDSDSALDSDTAEDSDSESGADTDTDTAPDTGNWQQIEASAEAKLIGENAGDAYGCGGDCISVAAAGDVNADGFDDVIVGLAGNTRGGTSMAGAAYLVHGPVPGAVDLSAADAVLVGSDSEYAGLDVASAGDVDGDSYSDIIVGAPYFGARDEGQTYVFLGPVAGVRALSSADAILHGEYVSDTYTDPSSYSGASVASAGDVNGDGLDDVLVGAYGYDGGRGVAYLLLAPFSGYQELATADVRIVGEGWALMGNGVASGGDTDGDGLDDILIGQPGEPSAVTLLFVGPVVGAAAGTDADATFATGRDFDYAGLAPRPARDVNGDGYADILIPAPWDDDGGEYAGAVYLVYGPAAGAIDLAFADAKLLGVSNEVAGISADGPGDVDDDGYADLVIGAPGFGSGGAGSTYFVRGPISGSRALSDADSKFSGEGDDRIGYAVAGAGDVDGDTHDDLLIGGPGDDDGGEDAGAAWLVVADSL